MKILMTTTNRQTNLARVFGLLVVATIPLLASGALAQQRAAAIPAPEAQNPAAQTATPTPEPPQGGQEPETGAPQTLHLMVGRSLVITSPNRIKRVSLADPAIAEAVVVSPTQLVINGKAPGGVSLILWDES